MVRSLKQGKDEGRGFSLLEVLVAMAILAIGVLGVAQLFVVAIHNNMEARDRTQTEIMISHRLEQLREIDYCKLKAKASPSWVTEGISFDNENMGQGADPKVFAGRYKKNVGGAALDTDWVIERRIIDGTVKGTINIDKQPVENILLIELRGYKRGHMTSKQMIHMSVYRTKRISDVTC